MYFRLLAEVARRDKHSAKIAENRLGIVKGATIRRDQGLISDMEVTEITAIVDEANAEDFHPLLYVIPFDPIAAIVKEVPVAERAHPLSEEFIIADLPGDAFDVIRLEAV